MVGALAISLRKGMGGGGVASSQKRFHRVGRISEGLMVGIFHDGFEPGVCSRKGRGWSLKN
jgi:hypothetical protein